VIRLGSLKYWYQRNKVDFLVSQSAVWNDDAVQGSLDCAAFWVKDLPFVKSLSGYWKFFIADRPSNVPTNFYESDFHDSEWKNLPGKCLCLSGICYRKTPLHSLCIISSLCLLNFFTIFSKFCFTIEFVVMVKCYYFALELIFVIFCS